MKQKNEYFDYSVKYNYPIALFKKIIMYDHK